MRNDVIHVRVSDDLKKTVDEILSDLGLTLSYAVNMYLKQIELKKGIPFPIELSDSKQSEDIYQLATSVNSMGGKDSSLYAQKILQLYAKNLIDRETALIALRSDEK